MSNNRFDLHEERLSTTDEKGHRVYLYPEDVKGKWRTRRHLFYWFLISLYLILPWIYVNGKQIILLNLPKREFFIFGFTFYGHDAPIVSLLLFVFIFLMGFITSVWGRVWCGWGCPQTVFIDSIYRPIERLIEGNARQRKKLNESPWDFIKLIKKSTKWILFTLVSLHISHSFLGYFVGTRNLIQISLQSPYENLALFITMISLTALFLFDFAWFKEQFCIIACPYGRFQSVMMDSDSLVIAYDQKRGEPRRHPEVSKENEGDCINCYHCVKVCPTGIDIRRGTQLECISCTNCIDACDEIMEKVGRPTGLIRYDSENGLNGIKEKKFKFRSAIYLIAITLCLGIFVYAIQNSYEIKLTAIRASRTPFTEVTDHNHTKLIQNFYKFRIDYKKEDNPELKIQIKDNTHEIKLVTPKNPIIIEKGVHKINVFFRFDKKILKNGSKSIFVELINTQNKVLSAKEVKLVGPIN